MHGQHGRRDERQRPFEERTQHEHERQAGGRSERFAQQRDREQSRAGYPAREWERDPERYHNVRSEPDWDPGYRRPPGQLRDERWRADAAFSEPRTYHESSRYEPGGFPQGLRPAGTRDWNSERDLRDYGQRSEFGQRIEDAGRRLVGKVKRLVRNPKNYRRSDERIREDICDRLAVSAEIDPSEVEVSVEAGEVTLAGFVADRSMKFVAEDIADDIPGVHDIHNQLRVRRVETAPVTNTHAQDTARDLPPPRGIGRS